MKILSVAGLLGDGAATWRIYNIANLLQAQGHEIHVVQYVRKATIERFKDKKVDLGNLTNSMVAVSPTTIHIKNLIEVERGHYDLVYGNTHYGTFYSILNRFIKIPLIFDMHGGLIEEFLLNQQDNPDWKFSPKRIMEYILDRIIDQCDTEYSSKILCVSNKMLNYLHEKKGVPLQKMAYVPNGIDLEFFKPKSDVYVRTLKTQYGLEGKFVIGYIGGQHKWQGLESLMRATKAINHPGIVFVFVGGAVTHKNGNKLIFSKVPRTNVIDYYSICDVLVLPRPSHPATEIAAPTKFAEYSAMCKPVLTTNVGDAAELVNKYQSGIVVHDNSSKCLIEGILELKYKTNEELKTMGHNSRILAENEFDWNKVVAPNLIQAVTDVINK
jgi:glycosyltransferase involved in cell wall biosynthesis